MEKALDMLVQDHDIAMVVIFHRDICLSLDDLVCYRTASFPTGITRVSDHDDDLDIFARFTAGFVPKNIFEHEEVRGEWRKICRSLGRKEKANPKELIFDSPNVMMAFTRRATVLSELAMQVPKTPENSNVKSREASRQKPAARFRPTDLCHIQHCVRWALEHDLSLTVIGGGHSDHCQRSQVVAIDMSTFDKVHIVNARDDDAEACSDTLVAVEAGCKAGEVIQKAIKAGITIPMGARPSVGAGLWLQGGIGHLARQHGLACDSIVGAVLVSVASGQVFCIGRVPKSHRPASAVKAENENEWLWGLKGAGSNMCIVVSVIFRAYEAHQHSVHNWVISLEDDCTARTRLREFDQLLASTLPRDCSSDAYLFWDSTLQLGVSLFSSSTDQASKEGLERARSFLGPEADSQEVDGVELFETEMYMSAMHGGHAGGKTSSFKRCVFLSNIGAVDIASRLIKAIRERPSPQCYLHLLHGGGAIGDVAAGATAFGCRDWQFACVITGVWRRDQDETNIAREAVQWVYDVVNDLLPLDEARGVYSADLGPDPRDSNLAIRAFGPNLMRLARLKSTLDPKGMLAYACPLPQTPQDPRLIVIITGAHGTGKDYCASIWASVLVSQNNKVRVASISDVTKMEYAAAHDADLRRLLGDRAYKEHHRQALTEFFSDQIRLRPQLPQEHFMNVVHQAGPVDVLFITGMRDEALVPTFSPLVPGSKLVEVRVSATAATVRDRRGNETQDSDDQAPENDVSPDLVFHNDAIGSEAVEGFGRKHLLPLCSRSLQQLADMVLEIPNFPRPGVMFRNILGISQHAGGFKLCTSLLQSHFLGDWSKVDAIVCCETGGFLFAPALSTQVNVPLALIREAGKLPPPVISVGKSPSHISAFVHNGQEVEKRIEMSRDLLPKNTSVVVIDDALATGKTLCAVLQLLSAAGVSVDKTSVMVIAEFPIHRGREFLRQSGFGRVRIQSLLVYGGA